MVEIKRVKTGIPGLDKLIEGGVPEGSSIMISGGAGTGKTNMCLQFLYHGANNKEPGVYITFEEDPEDLRITASRFGWDLAKLEKEKKLMIKKVESNLDINNVFKQIKDSVKEINAKRLVIDSLSSVTIYATTYESMVRDLPIGARRRIGPVVPSEKAIVQRTMYKLIDFIRNLNITAFLPSETENTEFSRYGIEEYVVDGVMVLHYINIAREVFANIEIRKMRKTKIKKGLYPLEISKKGLKVSGESISVLMK